jgi:hypothetical protein
MPRQFQVFPDQSFPIIPPLNANRKPLPGIRAKAEAEDWLISKKLVDTPPEHRNLWRIKNKLYDLSQFAKFHPGGSQFIQFTKGHDCTEAYESHHLDMARVDNVLSNFYVCDCNEGDPLETKRLDKVHKQYNIDKMTNNINKKENGIARRMALHVPTHIENKIKTKRQAMQSSRTFVYAPYEFYNILKKRVLLTLLNKTGAKTTMEATGPDWKMKIINYLVVFQFFALHSIAARFGSYALSILSGLSLIGCWGVGHNSMHQADATLGWMRYGVDLTYWSSRKTRITHCLSHHQYTNLHQDWEVTSIEHIFPFLPGGVFKNDSQMETKPGMKKFWQWNGLSAIFAFQPALKKLKWLKQAIETKGIADVELDEWAHCLPAFQLLNYIYHQGVIKGFLMFALQCSSFVLGFAPGALSVHHSAKKGGQNGSEERDTAAWHEGQSGASTDFGRHQVMATSDHSLSLSNGTFIGNYLSLCMYGFLNDHTAHHLFPGIDHSKHYIYRNVMQKTFKEFNVPYSTNSIFDLINGLKYLIENKKINLNALEL